jgi:exonuclease-1
LKFLNVKMGVAGLLENLKGITQKAHISEFRGKRVAVDGYCWLHRGAIFCGKELAHGDNPVRYITFFLNMIKLLQSEGIDAILVVFDGLPLPTKSLTNKKRSCERIAHKQLAFAAESVGDTESAQSHFRRSVSVTFEMVRALISALEKIGVYYMVAPYEADAQLAFLSRANIVDLVITEDSDALVYGCSNVLYKLDRGGNGDLIQREHLSLNQPMSFSNWTDEQIVLFCCLAGCDYLPGLRNFGIKSAYKVVGAHKTVSRVLDYLALHAHLSGSDRATFATQLQRAMMTFRHQTVYNPLTGRTEPLSPLPPHLEHSTTAPLQDTPLVGGHVRGALLRGRTADCKSVQELSFLGPQLAADVTELLVTGKLDPRTLAATLHSGVDSEGDTADVVDNTPQLPAPVVCWEQLEACASYRSFLASTASTAQAPVPCADSMPAPEPYAAAAGPTSRVVWTSPGDTELIGTSPGANLDICGGLPGAQRQVRRKRSATVSHTTASHAAASHSTQVFQSALVSAQLEPLHRRVKPRLAYLQLPRTGTAQIEHASSTEQDIEGTGLDEAADSSYALDAFPTIAPAGDGSPGPFFALWNPPSPVAAPLWHDLAQLSDSDTCIDDGCPITDWNSDLASPHAGLQMFQDDTFYPRFEQKLALFGTSGTTSTYPTAERCQGLSRFAAPVEELWYTRSATAAPSTDLYFEPAAPGSAWPVSPRQDSPDYSYGPRTDPVW